LGGDREFRVDGGVEPIADLNVQRVWFCGCQGVSLQYPQFGEVSLAISFLVVFWGEKPFLRSGLGEFWRSDLLGDCFVRVNAMMFCTGS
jgi:hypothetical protein